MFVISWFCWSVFVVCCLAALQELLKKDLVRSFGMGGMAVIFGLFAAVSTWGIS